jgi:hypothetical protein
VDLLQSIASVIGVISGVAGLGLGILNFVHQRDTIRPRLRVRPKVLALLDRENKSVENDVGIMEVANIGRVSVIGSTVGFHRNRKGEMGLVIVSPQPVTRGAWPGELKPGEVILLRMKLVKLPKPEDLGRAFVKTMVDDVFTCSRRDMNEFRKHLADYRGTDDVAHLPHIAA